MQTIRRKIDEIDTQILELLSKRQQLSLEIAEQKKGLNLPLRDDKREQEINERLKTQAAKLNLSSAFIVQLFELIFEESRRLQA